MDFETGARTVARDRRSRNDQRPVERLAALLLGLEPAAGLVLPPKGGVHKESSLGAADRLVPRRRSRRVAMPAPDEGWSMPGLGGIISEKASREVQCTVALIKNIVGSGVLVLPAGIARLSDAGLSSSDALTLAVALIVGTGAINAYGFYLIGEACAATKQGSYVGAWKETLGSSAAFLPAVASLLLCSTGAIANAAVIGDTCTDLLAALLQVDFETLPRNGVLAAVAAFGLTPLCLLPSLAPLGSASVLGVLGVFLTAGAMIYRLVDGSYAPGGQLLAELQVVPSFHAATPGPTSPLAVACFLSLISNAFVAHYNAPSVYDELSSGTVPAKEAVSKMPPFGLKRLRSAAVAERVNAQFESLIEEVPIPGTSLSPATPLKSKTREALRRFRRVVFSGYALSALLYLLIAVPGFLTFGDSAYPIIINNYASDDIAAVMARVGVLASVFFEFPLLERPFRLLALELFGNPEFLMGRAGAISSVALLVSFAAAGVSLDTLAALAGGTGGAFLIYIAPALMAMKLREANLQRETPGILDVSGQSLSALAAFGVAIGILETVDVLK